MSQRAAIPATAVALILLPALMGCTDDLEAPGAARRAAAPEWTTLTSLADAGRIARRALDALGGPGALEEAGGLVLDGEGTLDLGTLLQGRRPFEGDRHAIEERLAIVPADDRLVHELRAPLNPDAMAWQRVDHRSGGTYRIDMQSGRASWTRPGSRRSVERTIPHLLLDEVLKNPEGLRHLGSVDLEGELREAVSWHPPQRPAVTLLFDSGTGLLREVEALVDLPVRGDARVRWTFLPYETIPGLGPFPTGYTIHVDEEQLQEIRWRSRTAAAHGGVLDPPEDISLPEAAPFPDRGPSGSGAGGGTGDDGAGEDRTFDVRELAPGVHLLLSLRTGFHMLFVEFEDGVVAVDAPAGWWELQELPPRNWAGSASPELGERYVEAIRGRVGDKPIDYVVLTHHHSDHMGGVRAFVEAGATVLATEVTRPVVERTLAGSLLLAGRGTAPAPELRFETVEGRRTLRDATMEMEILDVGGNPHSEGMLAIWLPRQRIMYVSDLFDPWGSNGSPSSQRMPVMRWFVDWLDGSGLDPERIYAVHGSALVTEDHLHTVRDAMEPAG